MLWVTQDAGECAAADRTRTLGPDGRWAGPAAAEPGVAGSLEAAAEAHPAWPLSSHATLHVQILPRAPVAGRRIAVDRPVELVAAAGRPVALMGPNGSGKTVALEAIAGLAASDQVLLEWEGAESPGPILAAQHPELQGFGETVAEEFAFAPAQRGADVAIALELASQVLVEFGLDRAIMQRSTWELSSGERRLVQLASAIVTPASIVLVDEPTCGVDPVRMRLLGRLLRRIAQRVPVLVATQDERLPEWLGAVHVRLGQAL